MPPVRIRAEHAWIRKKPNRTGMSYHLRWICPIENRWRSRYVADTAEGAEAARTAFLDGYLSLDWRPRLSGFRRRKDVKSTNREHDEWLKQLSEADEWKDAKEAIRALKVLLRCPDHLRWLRDRLRLGETSST